MLKTAETFGVGLNRVGVMRLPEAEEEKRRKVTMMVKLVVNWTTSLIN